MSTKVSQVVDVVDIDGMTCVSCANRITKKLNKLPGVEAVVNFANESATIKHSKDFSIENLIEEIEHIGYSATPVNEEKEKQNWPKYYLTRLIVSALIGIPLATTAMLIMNPSKQLTWFLLIAAIPVVFWGGWPFHLAAYKNLLHHTVSMDTLVSLGILVTYFWSLTVTILGLSLPIYLDSCVVIVVFLTFSRYIDARGKLKARDAVKELSGMWVSNVTLEDGKVIPVDQLEPGMVFITKAGERVASDGVIVSGNASVDSSIVTGESVPRDFKLDDEIVGGFLVVDGLIKVKAVNVGKNSQLAKIQALIADVKEDKTKVTQLVDKIAGIFVPVVIVISLLTFFGWYIFDGNLARAVTNGVSVLVVACPCSLGLATSLALLAGTGRGAKLGLYVQGFAALEHAQGVNVVAFDKTGTLTEGKMVVENIIPENGFDKNQLLDYAATVESGSTHPIAKAIVNKAKENNLTLLPMSDFKQATSKGVSGLINNKLVKAGKIEYVSDQKSFKEEAGLTTIHVSVENQYVGRITVSDQVRQDASETVNTLHNNGLTTVILSGDNQENVDKVASQIGFKDTCLGGLTPEGKLKEIDKLQNEGKKVAFVGDGVNDAAALAKADLGIAIIGLEAGATSNDVASAAADILILGEQKASQLSRVNSALSLANAIRKTIKQNLTWAFGYNIILIPVAILGGLNPMLASASMAISSLFVTVNSLKLITMKLKG